MVVTHETPKKKTRRTPEQIVADLEAKIEAVKARAANREAKAAPEGKALIAALRALDKATEEARAVGDEEMVAALEAAHAPLGELMVGRGIRLPVRRKRGGGRRKRTAAA